MRSGHYHIICLSDDFLPITKFFQTQILFVTANIFSILKLLLPFTYLVKLENFSPTLNLLLCSSTKIFVFTHRKNKLCLKPATLLQLDDSIQYNIKFNKQTITNKSNLIITTNKILIIVVKQCIIRSSQSLDYPFDYPFNLLFT